MMDKGQGHDAAQDEALTKGQGDFMAALQKGPEHLPEHMFSGSAYRAFIGVKAHANTISHARLVALEDTYPRVRQRLGDERFNVLSREFVERADAMRSDINNLGAKFAEFLADKHEDGASIDLARIEWAWLQSYHAANAEALTMQHIAALDEDGLMGLPLEFHPSVRHIDLQTSLAPELGIDAAQADGAAAIAIVRKENEVLIFPQDQAQREIFQICEKSVLMRNLLESAIETIGEALAVQHVFALVEAGFLMHMSAN
jgi:hypothetical protein